MKGVNQKYAWILTQVEEAFNKRTKELKILHNYEVYTEE